MIAIREKLAEQSGQAMTEYMSVFIGAAVMMLALLAPMRRAVIPYLQQIYFFIGLPFP